MNELIDGNLNHYFCILLLVGRLGDIISTYIATPKLKLEANPIIRKLKWPYFVSTVLICLIPYYHNGIGLSFIVATYLLCFSNISKLWFITTIGEEKMYELTLSIAKKSRMLKPILCSLISNGFIVLIGLITILFYLKSSSWGYYIGLGFLLYSIGMIFHSIIYLRRVFNDSKVKNYISCIEEE